jgi:hypothetical protein
MQELKTTSPSDDSGDFELGMMLGSRKAFASVSGRCSAADAECIRRIRDKKLYVGRAPSWEEFCPQYLGLSKTHANRVIRYLEEFGPDYFELSQLTRVTPAQYRAIAPAIRDKKLHVDGEAIALLPENSDRIAAALAELRAEPPAPEESVEDRMTAVDRRLDRAIADFAEFSRSEMSLAERSQTGSVLSKALLALRRLELERGRPR